MSPHSLYPQTRAETSRYEYTSLHEDMMRFVTDLSSKYPYHADKRLFVGSFGTTPEGRDLPYLVLSQTGVQTAEEARALQKPVVLIISGIHAGEVEGKEACLMLARDFLDGYFWHGHGGYHPDSDANDMLAKMTIVIVPLFNPDGNDAIDAGNRKLHLPKLTGQLGPISGVGTRVNAAKINLNRDYMRQDGVEMRLLQQKICQVWQPDLTIDNHATNGSIHRFAMTYDIPHTIESGRAEPIVYMREQLLPPVTRALKQPPGIDAGWYGNFVEDERVLDADGEADPHSIVKEGWMTYPHHPRFGSNYRGLTNRIDLLLECYSYITFQERVETAYAFMLETLRYVAQHGDAILQTNAQSLMPRNEIAVRSDLTVFAEPVEILTRTPRTLDGTPNSVTIPYFGKFVGTKRIKRPFAYLVPAKVGQHLAQHGLQVQMPKAGHVYGVEVATIVSLGAEAGRGILEAAKVGEVGVAWKEANRTAPDGYAFVITEQPLGAIAVYLCEPESDDGAVENNLIPIPQAGSEYPIWRVWMA